MRERDAGETEGRKDRPVCVVVNLLIASGEHLLLLLAITSQPPSKAASALEIPALELRRAGLAALRRAWVIANEFNTDIVERSWYYNPNAVRGAFSPAFLKHVLEVFRPVLAKRARRWAVKSEAIIAYRPPQFDGVR